MSRRHFHRSEKAPDTRAERNLLAWDGKPFESRAIRMHVDQYCRDATLHGLRYIGDRKLTWFERFVCKIFWPASAFTNLRLSPFHFCI